MDYTIKPNLHLAGFLKDLIAEYDETRHDEILKSLSQKWNICLEDAEFCFEAVRSYNFKNSLINMGISATYDKNFQQVFRALDYLNGKIDENGNLRKTEKPKILFSK